MKNYLAKFKSDKIFRAVCIGDSTTSQEWCHPNWIDWLNFTFREGEDWQNGWKKKFINSGRDGAYIEHYLDNFDQEVSLYKPDVVIVSLGLNHIFLKSTPSEIEQPLNTLFTKIKNINADIVTWSPYAIPQEIYLEDLSKINSVYKSTTNKFDGTYIDTYTEFLKYDLNKLFTFKSDGNEEWGMKDGDIDFLHCNEIGCQIIANKIAKEAFKQDLSDWEFGTMKLKNLNSYMRSL